MARSYEPSPDAAALFARFKKHNDAVKSLTPSVKAMAVQEMRDRDAIAAEIAGLTGMTEETFRRLAREFGIERRKAPTVGRDAVSAQSRTSGGSNADDIAAATHRYEGTPPPELRIPNYIGNLPVEHVAALVTRIQRTNKAWYTQTLKANAAVEPRWINYMVVAIAVDNDVLRERDVQQL